ncbi:unnamed protein product [Cylindrotheca closterium]|uniref:DOMON domain-containing protein n=1 Tax=Cylindrotheca closterium TaxID=2856 RepID=A0AAD2FQB5_9STRA|nr:unnamed protein product [Cylindrotheca closterium]CAJ1967473.1 unnamed protein product [Cylindrotheca closterium]
MLSSSYSKIYCVVALCLGLLVQYTSANAIDLSVLGENSFDRLRVGWALTVNEQCLYEFSLQFEHDETLPLGQDNFEGDCSISGGGNAADGKPIFDARSSWDRFPRYVWATTGFHHMSIDWYPCGIFSGTAGQAGADGYSTAQYHFSFFRVTPEFRAETMTCDVTDQVVIPGEKVCKLEQDATNDKGLGFYIFPASITPVGVADKTAIVNMPDGFKPPVYGTARPHVGFRAWDQTMTPFAPDQWKDLPAFMSTYAGDLAMFQPHVSYRQVSGDTSKFTANAQRYHSETLRSLPDSFSVHYDSKNGLIHYRMVGKSQLCKEKFESAKAAAGGDPVFPNYNDYAFQKNFTENGGEGFTQTGGGGSSSAFAWDNHILLTLGITTTCIVLLTTVL